MVDKTTENRSLIREISAQVVGSDLETGYTFIYTWLANQFGHFMIGFAGTLACVWGASSLGWSYVLHPQTLREGVVVGAIATVWLLVWVLKEVLFDIAPSLKTLREAREKRIKDSENYYRVPRWSKYTLLITTKKQAANPGRSEESSDTSEQSLKRDLWHDSRMDIWFYFCGVLTALMMLYGPALATTWEKPWLAGGLPLLTFFILLFLSRWISAEWLWRNVAFDKARLPFVNRFALTKRPFEKVTRKGAIQFALSQKSSQNSSHSLNMIRKGLNSKTKHLVIIGPPKSGRTAAAVALGVEALLESTPPRNIVRYITLCKLLDRIVEGSQPEATPAWPPEEAELLIIDDVGAQTPPPAAPLLTSEHFEEILMQVLGTNDSLRAAGKTKRVIWVVGDDPGHAEQWRSVLNDVFGPFECDSEPCSVFLTDPIPLKERRRPMQHAKGATRAQTPHILAGILAGLTSGKSRDRSRPNAS